MYWKQITVLLFFFITKISAAQPIELLTYSTFQKIVKGNYANLENVSDDDGGYLTLQFKNISDSNITINNLICKRNNSNGVAPYTAFFQYPNSVAPNQYGVLVIKGSGNPFRENDSIVLSLNNQVFRKKNVTDKFKFANLIPNATLDTLLVYLRNDFTESVILKKIYINGSIINIESNFHLIASKDSVVPSKGICILKVPFSQPLKNCVPLFIGADYRRENGNSIEYSAAFTRNVEPDYPIGTWWSSAFDNGNQPKLEELRELHIGMTHGPGDFGKMQTAYNNYFISTINEPNFGNTFDTSVAAAVVRQHQDKNFIKTWTIDDEPDLNDKNIPEQINKNQTYWNNDNNTPSHVNLAVQRKFNRYGFYSDIISMDHYAAPPAPNIIALTWVPIIGRSANLDEALQYTEILKSNSEPRRLWSWVQFLPGPWSYIQDTFAYNIQFWMHIFGGAKGLELFVAQGHSKSTYPAMWRSAQNTIYMQSAIRNLCLYGEPYFNITSSNNKVITRSLVSENQMVLAAINNTVSYTWNGSFTPIKYNAAINKNLAYELTFELPDWISKDEVYKLGNNGKKIPVPLTFVSGKTYKITSPENLGTESHIFVIGKRDNTEPTAPNHLQIVNKTDSANYTLSWDFARDNIGVQGYILKKDNQLVDTVFAPVYVIKNQPSLCPEINWSVQAFDNSGNVGIAATVKLLQNVTIPSVSIIDQTDTLYANATDTTLQLFIQTQNVLSYQWQKSIDENYWYNIQNANNDTLKLSSDSTGTKYYRCILTGNCNALDTSDNSVVVRTTLTQAPQKNTIVSKIFPNPVNNILHIQLNNFSSTSTIEIIDVFGKVILQQNRIESANLNINVAALSKGVYFLQIKNNNTTEAIRFLKF